MASVTGGHGLEPAQVEVAGKFLRDRLSPHLIVLFGSAATGKAFRPESDVDLAFLRDGFLNDYDRFLLAQELAVILGREVDLIDLDRASTVLRAEVIRTGRTVYEGDRGRAMFWRMRALKDYALLNEERAPVIRRLKGHAR
ncbi:MAG: nucleotidyltransferase domain-containing protein [Bacillota bacterium]